MAFGMYMFTTSTTAISARISVISATPPIYHRIKRYLCPHRKLHLNKTVINTRTAFVTQYTDNSKIIVNISREIAIASLDSLPQMRDLVPTLITGCCMYLSTSLLLRENCEDSRQLLEVLQFRGAIIMR
ncbi:uncharacterized protein LOC126285334 [Schistocerca gregaria]|uniref:uncharacterized protein LOC126285334 n=1 Tax=Schistocerca gregaria TaxID=7010 RepID=UPI00211EF250|nr:uncharacterized protein LOC126285334 [Schistocerca gregaria]